MHRICSSSVVKRSGNADPRHHAGERNPHVLSGYECAITVLQVDDAVFRATYVRSGRRRARACTGSMETTAPDTSSASNLRIASIIIEPILSGRTS